MAAPERFAKSQICSCNAGTVHTWPFTTVSNYRFCSQCGVKLGEAAPAARPAAVTAPPAVSPRVTSSAERRQLTVMFCDLVGSTALSTRLDPEDLREVIDAYHACVAEVVTRFSGYVAKYMGDGVLIYFGFPEASETDAENAVRAALALIGAVSRLVVAGISHEVRVGLATGLVVVGELVGAGEAQERNVVGETPNLAARLQSAAAPNAVIVAATTRRLAGDLFEYEAIAPARSGALLIGLRRIWSKAGRKTPTFRKRRSVLTFWPEARSSAGLWPTATAQTSSTRASALAGTALQSSCRQDLPPRLT